MAQVKIEFEVDNVLASKDVKNNTVNAVQSSIDWQQPYRNGVLTLNVQDSGQLKKFGPGTKIQAILTLPD